LMLVLTLQFSTSGRGRRATSGSGRRAPPHEEAGARTVLPGVRTERPA
jgi:hypothetical protein